MVFETLIRSLLQAAILIAAVIAAGIQAFDGEYIAAGMIVVLLYAVADLIAPHPKDMELMNRYFDQIKNRDK